MLLASTGIKKMEMKTMDKKNRFSRGLLYEMENEKRKKNGAAIKSTIVWVCGIAYALAGLLTFGAWIQIVLYAKGIMPEIYTSGILASGLIATWLGFTLINKSAE